MAISHIPLYGFNTSRRAVTQLQAVQLLLTSDDFYPCLRQARCVP